MGLVVAVATCRRLSSGNDLARFGLAILDFKHPAQEDSVTCERFGRLFERLQVDDVLVLVSECALRQTSDEGSRTIRTLRRHHLVVKVLRHGALHLGVYEADRR